MSFKLSKEEKRAKDNVSNFISFLENERDSYKRKMDKFYDICPYVNHEKIIKNEKLIKKYYELMKNTSIYETLTDITNSVISFKNKVYFNKVDYDLNEMPIKFKRDIKWRLCSLAILSFIKSCLLKKQMEYSKKYYEFRNVEYERYLSYTELKEKYDRNDFSTRICYPNGFPDFKEYIKKTELMNKGRLLGSYSEIIYLTWLYRKVKCDFNL